MRTHEARITNQGQVTIPASVRETLGLADGDPVTFVDDDGVVTLRAARKPTLTELLAGFDPDKHRHSAEERVWDCTGPAALGEIESSI